MTPMLLTPPAGEPILLADAKAWLRLDTTAEDDSVSMLITAARLIVESTTRKLLLAQVWRLTGDAWPQSNIVKIPLAPFQAIVAMRVLDVNGAAQVLNPSLYTLDASPDGAHLLFKAAPPPPGQAIAGIQIDVAAGYGVAPASVPEPIRQAMRMLIARWYENRGDVAMDSGAAHLPASVAALLSPYRQMRLQ